jgi:outer membrane protein assembly factor BamE (lipoprotein component of BamABCDE complex)
MSPGVRSVLRGLALLVILAVALGAGSLFWYNRDTTKYAAGFTEEKFQKLKPGMGLAEVYSLLGRPLVVRQEASPAQWCFGESTFVRKDGAYVLEDFLSPPRCVVFDEIGVVLKTTGIGMAGIQPGMSAEQVLALLGEPDRRSPAVALTLHYTTPGGEGIFRGRIVAVNAKNRVSKVTSYEFHD